MLPLVSQKCIFFSCKSHRGSIWFILCRNRKKYKVSVTVNMNQSLYKISIPSAGGILVMLVNQSQTKKPGVLTEKTQMSEMKINRWLLIFVGELKKNRIRLVYTCIGKYTVVLLHNQIRHSFDEILCQFYTNPSGLKPSRKVQLSTR